MKKSLFIFLVLVFVFSLPSFPLQAKGTAAKSVKILIVPGHDDEVFGAQYGNLKEANMNLVLATQIYNLLKKDKRFEVYIARNKNGYAKVFQDYFNAHQEDIIAFRDKAKEEMQAEISSGNFISKTIVPHVSVKPSVSIKLYGINKWANENNIDAVLHVHFDDYPRPTKWVMGEYKGFSVYMPDQQMPNAAESDNLAKNIFTELSKKYIPSTYDKESGGLIPDQKLIALGASETLNKNVRSVLIEYGYIYRFGNSAMRQKSYKTMADLTSKGIKNYFFPHKIL